jgi:hypothetical protein
VGGYPARLAIDRLPLVVWPGGHEDGRQTRWLLEVQTPPTGETAAQLAVGDRVWLRHPEGGEERTSSDAFVLVDETA